MRKFSYATHFQQFESHLDDARTPLIRRTSVVVAFEKRTQFFQAFYFIKLALGSYSIIAFFFKFWRWSK